MRDQSTREPLSVDVEGAPTLVYEVWDWVDSDRSWKPLAPEACHYRFIGYRTLSLRQVLKYQAFGYHVERSRSVDARNVARGSDDRGCAIPLFPLLGTAQADQGEGLD